MMDNTIIKKKILEITEQMIAWRRYLHQHPELSFEETATSQFVYDTLRPLIGLEISRPTRTSVVASLKGKAPGRVLAIRADMDALAIQEENTYVFSSIHTGVMHACGHDGHTAVLLAAAKILSEMKDAIHGEIRFIFQHGEELPPGGAQELVQAGILDGVDIIIGAHLWSPLEVGKISILPGPTMAGGDLFNIKVQGIGGHAGMPHQTVDPVTLAAQVITNLQQIVSRQSDPLDSLVVSITKLSAGMTHNAIPDSAELSGTVRYFNPRYRKDAPIWMERMIKGVTQAHAAAYSFEYMNGYLPVTSDPDVARMLKNTVEQHMGHEFLENMRPPMVGEDFSSYLSEVPGCFVFIGAGNKKEGITYPHHHPRFDIDEGALSITLNIFVHFAIDYLAKT